jgi:hypothetical protein
MKLEDKIVMTLTQLSPLELRLCEKDCHRAADACAIGGGSHRQWNRYVRMENLFKYERERRNIEEWVIVAEEHATDELKVLEEAWRKIKSIKAKGGAE